MISAPGVAAAEGLRLDTGAVQGESMIKTILIADDSPVARKVLRSCIPKDQGFEFHEVGDGLAAVEKYQEIHPDLTFMDLTMPVMDGIQALARIKQLDRDAIVIVATADIQRKTMEKVTELGAFMLLKKPPSKESVSAGIREANKHLESRR